MRDAPDSRNSRVTSALPLSDAELVGLGEAAFAGVGFLVLAVSGGPDSMALMLLASRWRAVAGAGAPPIEVATVDHGLRPGSADEARWVAGQAAAMGFKHHALEWAGTKPASGRQQAARAARYALLADLAARQTPDAPGGRPAGIALAHHQDDQAETFVMRLQRGSGLDGLAAMRHVRSHVAGPTLASGWLVAGRLEARPEIRIVRPLLTVAKSRLQATLQARGVAWLADPSNANPEFERVRVRAAMPALAGLGITSAALATSASRLARAAAALEQLTDELAGRALITHHGAYARIATSDVDPAPAELRLRLLQRLVRWYGGAEESPRMTKLEALVERLALGHPMAATLAGCQIRRTSAAILAFREPGRQGMPELVLRPGEAALWDRRFLVAAGQAQPGPVVVKALPAETLTRLNAELRRTIAEAASPIRKVATNMPRTTAIDLPRAAALSLPSFWHDGCLLAVAHPAFDVCGLATPHDGLVRGNLSARFVTRPT